MEFNFDNMVNEAYTQLEHSNENNKIYLPQFEVEIGTTRLHWKNTEQYLNLINRDPNHFIDFLKKELLGKDINWFSGSISDGLIIHGKRLKKTDITNISIKYVERFVICPCCKKTKSTMVKDQKKYEYECLECGFKKYL